MIAQKNFFRASAEDFKKIPGSPVAYWAGTICDCFQKKNIGSLANVITGMTIGDNALYLRLWFEVSRSRIAFNAKIMAQVDFGKTYWIPYSKGGARRNWSGNYEYVVNWAKHGNFNRAKTTLSHLYLKEALTWPFITSGRFSARFLPEGSLWDVAGSPCFVESQDMEMYILGFLHYHPTRV